MPVHVKIPTPLRKFTADKDTVSADGPTVGAVLKAIDANHPGLWAKICDDQGKVRRFINVYAGEDDIRFLQGLDTPVAEGGEISIVPAVAGG